MNIDMTMHSLFGVSKTSADLMVQEYGRYFEMPTVCFRGGCLTGPNHAGAQLHGFLSYLMRCTMTGDSYTVFGYGGKQVRDNIHSADLVDAFAAFIRAPRVAEVYNIGGSRHSNCSMLEAINLCEEISGQRLTWKYEEANRIGDHIWWISSNDRFKSHFPEWKIRRGVPMILALTHGRDLEYQRIVDAIRSFDVPYLHEVGLRDRFIPAEPDDIIKTTLGMWYQAFDRSLTQEEIVGYHQNLASRLAATLPVKLL